jgi:hypothetical protein
VLFGWHGDFVSLCRCLTTNKCILAKSQGIGAGVIPCNGTETCQSGTFDQRQTTAQDAKTKYLLRQFQSMCSIATKNPLLQVKDAANNHAWKILPSVTLLARRSLATSSSRIQSSGAPADEVLNAQISMVPFIVVCSVCGVYYYYIIIVSLMLVVLK